MALVESSIIDKDYTAYETTKGKEKISNKQMAQKAGEEIDRTLKWITYVKEAHPDFWSKVEKKDPTISTQLKTLSALNSELKKNSDKTEQLLDRYNKLAPEINKVFTQATKKQQENEKLNNASATQLGLGELVINEKNLSAAQKKELKQFAKEAWKTIFPESQTEKYIKSLTGQQELYSSQKILWLYLT